MEKKCQIKIYSYKDKNPKGYLYYAAYPEAKPFWSLTQLLFLLDELPETEETVIRFRPDIRGAMAALDITLSEDWRGEIAWVKKTARPFDGVMAFVRTLDSVFTEKKTWKPEKEVPTELNAEAPEEGKEPEKTEAPEESEKPEKTEAPEECKEPEKAEAPEKIKAPEEAEAEKDAGKDTAP